MLWCCLSYSRHAGSKGKSSNVDGDEQRKPSCSRRLEHRESNRGEDCKSNDDNDDDDNDYNGDEDEKESAEDGNPNQTTRKLNPLRI